MSRPLRNWPLALLHAVPISLFVLGLFYYWFVSANRAVVFLYNNLAAGPFGQTTMSRYWMTGLVAAGAVLVGYTLFGWFGGRIADVYYRSLVVPKWWQVWCLCVPFLATGIPVITMMGNQPVMPPGVALACLGAALAGLVLALPPCSLAAHQPAEFGWLALGGLGLMPPLLLVRAVELPGLRLAPAQLAYTAAMLGVVIGGAWLATLAWLRVMRRAQPMRWESLLVAGLCLSFVLLPLIHYLVFVPPEYRYISVSANFFAVTPWAQLLSLATAALMAVGSTALEKWLNAGSAEFGQGHVLDKIQEASDAPQA